MSPWQPLTTFDFSAPPTLCAFYWDQTRELYVGFYDPASTPERAKWPWILLNCLDPVRVLAPAFERELEPYTGLLTDSYSRDNPPTLWCPLCSTLTARLPENFGKRSLSGNPGATFPPNDPSQP